MAHSSTMEKLDSPAPDFNLNNWNPLLQQESYGLDSFKNHRSLLVAFFCNHCPYVVHIRESFVHFANELINLKLPEQYQYIELVKNMKIEEKDKDLQLIKNDILDKIRGES